MMIDLKQKFLDEVEASIKSLKMDATGFGRSAVNNPNFVFELRAGRESRQETIEKVRNFVIAEKQRRKKAKAREKAKAWRKLERDALAAGFTR